MKILHIPCLEDNYAYLIIDESSRDAAVVDPVEPEKVLKVADENGVVPKLVLTTHHHWDHAGGNEKIKKLVPGIRVFGGSLDNVKGCTDQVEHGDKISLGNEVNVLAFHTPCHTKGHISYFISSKGEDPAVFTGDTLFIAGCGKFFEGTAEQMYQSLCKTLGSLPKTTRVYCGHEYTEKNLRFALTVEPENEQMKQKLAWVKHQREANQPTVPSTIEDEMGTNPFMRVDLPELQNRVGCSTPVEALKEIRRMKDNWRG
ncbi:hydroxyacylglutathione hydrolase cytoplasmic-like [Nymphaea colorata]|nr:hydroxyacylglutathione hydrolase cytoplasmic-like [Nymphaea colorata]